jgi:hypothetical protein
MLNERDSRPRLENVRHRTGTSSVPRSSYTPPRAVSTTDFRFREFIRTSIDPVGMPPLAVRDSRLACDGGWGRKGAVNGSEHCALNPRLAGQQVGGWQVGRLSD